MVAPNRPAHFKDIDAANPGNFVAEPTLPSVGGLDPPIQVKILFLRLLT
jgi:hypothetical protein